MGVRSILNLFSMPIYLRESFEQMDIIGVGSVVITALTGFFTGAVLALQTSKTLSSFGAIAYTGQLVSVSLVRELGPVLTAVVVAGRIGSGIASELGSMVVSEQIHAMRALGTDPTYGSWSLPGCLLRLPWCPSSRLSVTLSESWEGSLWPIFFSESIRAYTSLPPTINSVITTSFRV